MTDRLMEADEASDYTRTAENYLLNQAKSGRVAYIMTSPKKILFDRTDLDRWMAGWRKMEVTAQ